MSYLTQGFRIAMIASRKSTSRFKIGAAVFRNRKLISIGFNKMDKSHPGMGHLKRIHAEFDAVMNIDVRGCDIFIYRETKAGIPVLSEPCEFCGPLLRTLGIRRVYHT